MTSINAVVRVTNILNPSVRRKLKTDRGTTVEQRTWQWTDTVKIQNENRVRLPESRTQRHPPLSSLKPERRNWLSRWTGPDIVASVGSITGRKLPLCRGQSAAERRGSDGAVGSETSPHLPPLSETERAPSGDQSVPLQVTERPDTPPDDCR